MIYPFLQLEDGTEIALANFYNVFSEDELPEFVLDGTTLTAQEFFAMQGNENLMPAAGPKKGKAKPKAKTSGGRSDEAGRRGRTRKGAGTGAGL